LPVIKNTKLIFAQNLRTN